MDRAKHRSEQSKLHWPMRVRDLKKGLSGDLHGDQPTIVLVRTRNARQPKYGPKRRRKRTALLSTSLRSAACAIATFVAATMVSLVV